MSGGKGVRRTADGLEELYELSSDPEERVNMTGSPNVQVILERFRNTLGLMKKRGQRRARPSHERPVAERSRCSACGVRGGYRARICRSPVCGPLKRPDEWVQRQQTAHEPRVGGDEGTPLSLGEGHTEAVVDTNSRLGRDLVRPRQERKGCVQRGQVGEEIREVLPAFRRM
jgi:hypothetical protein